MSNRELDDLYLDDEGDAAEDEEFQEFPVNRVPSSGDRRPSSDKKRKPPKGHGILGLIVGILVGVLACTAVFGITTIKSKATAMELDYQTKLDLLLNYLERYYIDELDPEMLEDAIAKGLMKNIGDKYAEYYTVEEFQNLVEQMSGEYAGIGVLIVQTDDGRIMVYQVYDNSPAQEAGIQITDIIVEADGRRDFETMDDLVALVRGEPGTTVDIVVERNGEEIPLTVERRYIEIVSVGSVMLDDTLGYIQLTEFNATTAPQLETAVESLLEQGMQELIIDLRDNPGGDYDSVVAACDYVLPEGPIVTIEDRLGGISTKNSGPECLNIPIVLLVNENTASAAELFTMALMDYGAAQTVGTRTYGKGIVQSIFQLVDGSGVKFTTERYYGPKGNCIQDTGIEPDYTVELPEEVYEDGIITVAEDLQLQKAAELLGHTLDTEMEDAEAEPNEEIEE